MSQVNNSQVLQELRDAAKLQVGRDKIPSYLSSGIMPTIELNPKVVKTALSRSEGDLTDATSATLITANANKDIYITGYEIAWIKDANATATFFGISYLQNGATTRLCKIPSITLTAHHGAFAVSLPHPIKIDRNTAVSLFSDTNVSLIRVRAVIYYYEDEAANG